MFGKKNIVKIDPFAYNICLIGEGGIGKTTLVKQFCEKYLGEDGYIFAECGKEDGADAISGINYVNCPDWNSDYDELENSVGFKLLIEDILENKDTDYPNLKVLVVDTYNQLRAIAEPEIVRQHNKLHPDKKTTTINGAFGGFGEGEDKCDELVLDMLWSLKNVGVHFIVIGHVKQRDVTDIASGEQYSQLTTDMSIRAFNALKTKLHFLGVASIDREIVKKKKSETDKKPKGHVTSEARRITFRDDNYAIDSKSRFADIAPECEMTAEALYQTLVDAIEAEASKGEGGLKAAQKAQKSCDEAKAKKAMEFSDNLRENPVDSERNAELIDIIKTGYQSTEDEDIKAQVKAAIKANGGKISAMIDCPTATLEELAALFN